MQRDRFFLAWIIAAFVSTCYTLTWDIKMDWGLLDKNATGENRFLREETVYRSKVRLLSCTIHEGVWLWLRSWVLKGAVRGNLSKIQQLKALKEGIANTTNIKEGTYGQTWQPANTAVSSCCSPLRTFRLAKRPWLRRRRNGCIRMLQTWRRFKLIKLGFLKTC